MDMGAGSQEAASAVGRARGALGAFVRGGGLSSAGIAALGLLGIVLTLSDTPLWWFGGALLLVTGSLLLRQTRGIRQRWAPRLGTPRQLLGVRVTPLALGAELVCVAIIAGVGLVMM